jgi:hypothetical protein
VCVGVEHAGANTLTAGVPSPKLNEKRLIPVASLSVDAQAFAITPSGATPELGITVSLAMGGWSWIGVGVGVLGGVAVGWGVGVFVGNGVGVEVGSGVAVAVG